MVLATLTICGFLLRGYWMMSDSGLRQNRATKVLPHIIDTLFLATGIWLVVVLGLAPLQHAWLLAKFAGLAAYIVLGAVALRRGPTMQVRLLAFVGAISAFAYIAGCALAKSPFSWLAFLTR